MLSYASCCPIGLLGNCSFASHASLVLPLVPQITWPTKRCPQMVGKALPTATEIERKEGSSHLKRVNSREKESLSSLRTLRITVKLRKSGRMHQKRGRGRGWGRVSFFQEQSGDNDVLMRVVLDGQHSVCRYQLSEPFNSSQQQERCVQSKLNAPNLAQNTQTHTSTSNTANTRTQRVNTISTSTLHDTRTRIFFVESVPPKRNSLDIC